LSRFDTIPACDGIIDRRRRQTTSASRTQFQIQAFCSSRKIVCRKGALIITGPTTAQSAQLNASQSQAGYDFLVLVIVIVS